MPAGLPPGVRIAPEPYAEGPGIWLHWLKTAVSINCMERRRRIPRDKRLGISWKKMQPVKIKSERDTSIANAFASALAVVDDYDEDAINKAMEICGQYPPADLPCVYCGDLATEADHLNGLVRAKQYSGHGHVIGNLVPCCSRCNRNKQNRPWSEWGTNSKWALEVGPLSAQRYAQIAKYESLAPPTVDYEQLRKRYRDLISEYEQLQIQILEAIDRADVIAQQIQNREKQRRRGDRFGNNADGVGNQ